MLLSKDSAYVAYVFPKLNFRLGKGKRGDAGF